MKISYKGVKQELPPKIQEKLDAKFAKVSKFLEKRGEKEAHVVVTSERHLHHAEITVPFYDHQLVSVGSDADLFTALSIALEKLESQAQKLSSKFREKKRRKEGPVKGEEGTGELIGVFSSSDGEPESMRIFRVNHHEDRKPMTLEEALLEIGKDENYIVYRDADKDCLSVLVRRRDGHFDLIEG